MWALTTVIPNPLLAIHAEDPVPLRPFLAAKHTVQLMPTPVPDPKALPPIFITSTRNMVKAQKSEFSYSATTALQSTIVFEGFNSIT
jgi:hypothetical protein